MPWRTWLKRVLNRSILPSVRVSSAVAALFRAAGVRVIRPDASEIVEGTLDLNELVGEAVLVICLSPFYDLLTGNADMHNLLTGSSGNSETDVSRAHAQSTPVFLLFCENTPDYPALRRLLRERNYIVHEYRA